MPNFEELTWEEAMRRGHAALLDSEHLHDDINASEGRSNLDIEKHLRRSEVRAAHAHVWLALVRKLGNQGDRHGHPGTCSCGQPVGSAYRLIARKSSLVEAAPS